MTAAARALAVAAAALAGCPAPEPARPVLPSPGLGSSAVADAAPAPAADAAEAPEEERLAAIQKAMNELDEGAQECWAAAATDRFDLAGELVARIAIGRPQTRVTFVRNTTGSGKLAGCMLMVLAAYRWAPPLDGQTIQLPFRFRAPDGQNVIDRRMVVQSVQGKVAVSVLLDEQNTGNGAASMFAVAIEAGGATGMRIAERSELWYFLRPVAVGAPGAARPRAVAAGDMMYVPAGAARDVIAVPPESPKTDALNSPHAVVVIAPGGREGAARAGALPTPELTRNRAAVAGPVHLPASAARRYPRPAGAVTIFAEPATTRAKDLAATIIELPKGGAIPEHVHAGESELLFLLAGSGTMTVKGVPLAVLSTTVVQIPPSTPHAFSAAEDVRAVQIYTPAGPEQRFKAAPAPPPPPAPKANP